MATAHVVSGAHIASQAPQVDDSIRFAPGLMMMEFVTVFFPLIEAYQARYHRNVTITALDEWEKNRLADGSLSSDSLKPTSTLNKSDKQGRRDLYSMQHLEKTLSEDVSDLLQFAATKEFTGENIVFLTQIRDWKRCWHQESTMKTHMSREAKRRLYNNAAEIFFSSVCLQTAQFPVNVEHRVYVALEQLFRAQSTPIQRSDVTPFADDVTSPSGSTRHGSHPPFTLGHQASDEELVNSDYFVPDSNVPPNFNGTVFDRAEASVKYMVFTNTWVRYAANHPQLGDPVLTLAIVTLIQLRRRVCEAALMAPVRPVASSRPSARKHNTRGERVCESTLVPNLDINLLILACYDCLASKISLMRLDTFKPAGSYRFSISQAIFLAVEPCG